MTTLVTCPWEHATCTRDTGALFWKSFLEVVGPFWPFLQFWALLGSFGKFFEISGPLGRFWRFLESFGVLPTKFPKCVDKTQVCSDQDQDFTRTLAGPSWTLAGPPDQVLLHHSQVCPHGPTANVRSHCISGMPRGFRAQPKRGHRSPLPSPPEPPQAAQRQSSAFLYSPSPLPNAPRHNTQEPARRAPRLHLSPHFTVQYSPHSPHA